MSADVWIERDTCSSCGRGEPDDEVNITYNLSGMLREAGFVGWQELLLMSANQAGEHLIAVLDLMRGEPDKWREKNPPNGWGDYDKCLQGRLREFAEKCLAAGTSDRIGGSL